MSGQLVGGGASVLEGSRRPPSLRAVRSAALTYSRGNRGPIITCLHLLVMSLTGKTIGMQLV